MTRRSAILLLPLGLASLLASADPLADCRKIAADAGRLACYDALADRRLAEPAVTGVASASAAAAATPMPPEEMFGRPSAEVRRTVANDTLEELTARVTAVDKSPSDKLVVSLDNGQVWSQVDSAGPRVKTGDEVRIKRASLGSYLMTRTGGGPAIRVHRTR